MLIVTKEMEDAALDDTFARAYQSWLDHPMTQKMLRFTQEASRPLSLPEIKPEAALYYAGQVDHDFDVRTVLTEFVPRVRQYAKAKGVKKLASTYGVPSASKGEVGGR